MSSALVSNESYTPSTQCCPRRAAGKLIDCLRNIRHFYPRIAPDKLRVTVLHSSERLLPGLSPRLDAATTRGRIIVRGDLSVPGTPGLWAVGDCACVPNALNGSASPPTAQFAVRQARHLAGNLIPTLKA